MYHYSDYTVFKFQRVKLFYVQALSSTLLSLLYTTLIFVIININKCFAFKTFPSTSTSFFVEEVRKRRKNITGVKLCWNMENCCFLRLLLVLWVPYYVVLNDEDNVTQHISIKLSLDRSKHLFSHPPLLVHWCSQCDQVYSQETMISLIKPQPNATKWYRSHQKNYWNRKSECLTLK